MIQNNPASSTELAWIQRVEKMATEVAVREGCLLYDLEFVPGRILRVFIDREQGGAGIDDCSNVSKGLNLLLDVDDVVPGGKYHLEVSTPGIDRNLRKLWHFEKAVGQKIWLKARGAFETYGTTHPQYLKAKQVEGTLLSVVDDRITVQTAQTNIEIPYAEIEKSKIVFEMKKNDKKPRG